MFNIFDKDKDYPKNLFYKYYNELNQEGLMKEIYNCEDFSICNLANSCYVVFTYKLHQNYPVGVLFPQSFLREIIYDSKNLGKIWHSFNRESRKNSAVVLDPETITILRDIKKRTDAQGPEIDLEYEERLLNDLNSGGRK